jgi:hypothetical protein
MERCGVEGAFRFRFDLDDSSSSDMGGIPVLLFDPARIY